MKRKQTWLSLAAWVITILIVSGAFLLFKNQAISIMLGALRNVRQMML